MAVQQRFTNCVVNLLQLGQYATLKDMLQVIFPSICLGNKTALEQISAYKKSLLSMHIIFNETFKNENELGMVDCLTTV